MILVAGGTGRLGREIVARLTATGRDVRVLTRRPERAEGLAVDVCLGDVRDPASLTVATSGCSVVISAVHGFAGGRGAGPEEVDHQGSLNLLRAAVDAGVQHFVLVSVLDARPDHPMALHRAKYAAEQHLHASGLPWTVLRPSAYLETWLDIVGGKVRAGGPALVFGRADNAINFVSVQDVATLVERALTDPALRGQRIDVVGPDNLTMVELAQHAGAPRVQHVPRAALRLLSTALAPVVPGFARQNGAALVMDTIDMAADPSGLRERFPDIAWHRVTDVAQR